jgi:hypothetical protein
MRLCDNGGPAGADAIHSRGAVSACQHAAGEGKFSAFHGPVFCLHQGQREDGLIGAASPRSAMHLPVSASDLSDAGAISAMCRRSESKTWTPYPT